MLHVAVATRAFRRYSTYRAATLAGIFTNSVFGIIYSYAYLALWDANPTAGGYDSQDAVTYVWLGQALLMTIALWGGGTTDDLAERIRTGDVAIDLYRPVGLVGLVPRQRPRPGGVPPPHPRASGPRSSASSSSTSRCPSSPVAALAFAVSLVLAVVVSFAIRFLVASTAFWLLDQSGVKVMSGAFAIFFSGMMLPLVLFPGLARDARQRAAVGVVRPGPRRHLARQAHRRRPRWRALGLPGDLGRRPAGRLPGRAAPRDAQGGGPGWLRPAAALHLRTYVPDRLALDPRGVAVPDVVRPARGRQRADHRPRLRRPVDHVRPPRRPRGLHAPRGGPALRQRLARARPSPTRRSAASSGSAPTSAPAGSTR